MSPLAADRGVLRRVATILLSPWGRLVLLVLLLAGAAGTVLAIGPDHVLRGRTDSAASVAWAGPAFVALYAVGTMAFVPKPALSAAAGAVFGVGQGLVLAVAGTVLGALLGFGAGRLLGRDALRPVLRFDLLAALERRLSDRAFTSILGLRLLPVMPFAVVNLGAALSRMRWPPFAVATALGTFPGNAVWVLAGTSASAPSSTGLWLPAAAAGVLAGAVAVRRVARRRAGRLRSSP